MKKGILSIALGLAIMAIGTTTKAADKTFVNSKKLTANEKAVKDFTKQFKNAVTLTIYSAGDGFIVNSDSAGNKVTSAYNKKGSWVYTIERYATDKPVAEIVDIVKDSYENYTIAGMEKIDQPGFNTVYIVHLENCHSIKTVRVTNEEVELVQDFEKG
jgi:hypothetical protein